MVQAVGVGSAASVAVGVLVGTEGDGWGWHGVRIGIASPCFRSILAASFPLSSGDWTYPRHPPVGIGVIVGLGVTPVAVGSVVAEAVSVPVVGEALRMAVAVKVGLRV